MQATGNIILSTASFEGDAAILIDGAPVPVRIRRSARARAYRLTLDSARGGLRLSLPARANLKKALAAIGATFADVVKTNVYIVNYQTDMLGMIRDVRSQYLPQENAPASTLIGVQALALDGLLIEIEAVAIVKA